MLVWLQQGQHCKPLCSLLSDEPIKVELSCYNSLSLFEKAFVSASLRTVTEQAPTDTLGVNLDRFTKVPDHLLVLLVSFFAEFVSFYSGYLFYLWLCFLLTFFFLFFSFQFIRTALQLRLLFYRFLFIYTIVLNIVNRLWIYIILVCNRLFFIRILFLKADHKLEYLTQKLALEFVVGEWSHSDVCKHCQGKEQSTTICQPV